MRDEKKIEELRKKFNGKKIKLNVLRVNDEPSPTLGAYSAIYGEGMREEVEGKYGKSYAIKTSSFIAMTLTERKPDFQQGDQVEITVVDFDWTPEGTLDRQGNPRPSIPMAKCLLV